MWKSGLYVDLDIIALLHLLTRLDLLTILDVIGILMFLTNTRHFNTTRPIHKYKDQKNGAFGPNFKLLDMLTYTTGHFKK